MANKYHLERSIPEDVKRSVRQRCGFSCIHCTSALYHYDHFGVPFKDATEHNPDLITLLCPAMHDAKTRGHLAESTVLDWDTKRKNARPSAQSMPIDLQTEAHPSFDFGHIRVVNTPIILRIAGENVVEFLAPECAGAPYRLNARFDTIDDGELVLIRENEWLARTSIWDINTVGPVTTLRRSPGDIALQWRVDPPNGLAVERLRMSHAGLQIDINAHDVKMHLKNGAVVKIGPAAILDAPAAIDIDSRGNLVIGKGGEVRFSEVRAELPGVTNEWELQGIQFTSYSAFFETLTSRDANLTLNFVFVDDRPKVP